MCLSIVAGRVGRHVGGAQTVLHGGLRRQPGRQDRYPRGDWLLLIK